MAVRLLFLCVVLCRPNSAFAPAAYNVICHLQGQWGSPDFGTVILEEFGNPCCNLSLLTKV